MIGRWQRMPTHLLLLLFGLGAAVLCHYLPCQLLVDQPALINYLHMAGRKAMVLFLIAHVMATAVGLPGTWLVVSGGAVFGLVWGTILSTIGATLGAIAAFYLARLLLRHRIEHRFSQHKIMQKLNQMVSCHQLRCVLAIRVAPISPFNLVNFLFGLTPIHLRPYALGTFLGIIPGTAAYTWLGESGLKAFRGEGLTQLMAALVCLALLSLLPLLKPQK